MKKYIFMVALFFLILFVFGCKVDSDCYKLNPEERDECCAVANKDTPHIQCVGEWVWDDESNGCSFVCQSQVANPATKYCKDQGYTWDVIKDSQGNEYGICKFPDGSECEEWDYFNRRCKPGDTTFAVPVTKEECEGLGGKWGRFGFASVDRCNLPTNDGGKPCADSSECGAGLCIADSPDASLGKCPEWKLNFGCMTIIESGKSVGVCID